MQKKNKRIIQIIVGITSLFLVYQSIIQIRFVEPGLPLYIFILVVYSYKVFKFLKYEKANYPVFRWIPPVVLIIIAAGIALTMPEANAWVW